MSAVYAQPEPNAQPPAPQPASMDAKWVSAIVGMSVTTPSGSYLGRVRDVIVDGYGQPTHAIVAYGGMMGLGNKYAAVPWSTVADMLQRDRLVVDQAHLENAPTLAGPKPASVDASWRHDANLYWSARSAAVDAGAERVRSATKRPVLRE